MERTWSRILTVLSQCLVEFFHQFVSLAMSSVDTILIAYEQIWVNSVLFLVKLP
jgi:hypothetical protein